jgi:hypothetical protein
LGCIHPRPKSRFHAFCLFDKLGQIVGFGERDVVIGQEGFQHLFGCLLAMKDSGIQEGM